MTRVYESNGPDVKIRGTAHHVAEKYLQLARDAQSSGDPVSSEGYLQHAEHYFRLIAASQQQSPQQSQQSNPPQQGQPFQRTDEFRADAEDEYGDEGDDMNSPPYQQSSAPVQNAPRPQQPQSQPQPNFQPQQNAPRNDAPRNEQPREPEGGLPAFITGGAPQPQGNFSNPDQEQGEQRNDRFGRNRRRGRFRPRGPNDGEQRDPETAEAAPAPAQPKPDPVE